MGTVGTCVLLAGLLAACASATEEGLIVWYSFEEAADSVVRDRSGSGNDGKLVGAATCTKSAQGSALDLDGATGYVDSGSATGLDISKAGSISVWCNPRTNQGGIVNWSTGTGWADERLVLAVNTYNGGDRLLGCMADGKSFQQLHALGELNVGEWTHLAIAFNGKTVQLYRDGLLCASTSQSLQPELSAVPLWIGRCLGLGKEHFDGLLDEVRIYNRALSAQEVLTLYKSEAARLGKDVTLFERVSIAAAAYPGPGRIVAALDARAMQPLPANARILAVLQKPKDGAAVRNATVPDIPSGRPAEITFDVQQLAPGQYEIVARVVDAGNKRIGEEARATVRWDGQPEAFAGIRILNNLVWELANIEAGTTAITGRHVFSNPTARWVLIRSVAKVPEGGRLSIRLRSEKETEEVIVYRGADSTTMEAMRFLAAGEYALDVRPHRGAKVEHLVVRSIPMIQHAFYGANPHIKPYGPYDWDFLAKDVLPNVNVMIGGPGAELASWKKSGRKWISITNIPKVAADDPEAVDKMYSAWSGATGFQHPLMDGVIVDEFGGGDQPIFDVYRQAVERIHADPRFAGRALMPYCGTLYGKDRSSDFARATIETGGYMCWERYLTEQPDEQAANDLIRRTIVAEMPRWEACFPDAASKICLVLGYMSQPTESLNIDPGVNYKVYMDMQLHTLATHPSLFGLGGIQEYHSSYCDEENVRWAGLLYRHYCIEGRTEPLTTDPYILPHLVNPDFGEGTAAWSVQAAEEGSVRTDRSAGYGWLEGRYPRTNRGDTFLLMRRSATKPNIVSQEIGKLTASRLYSLKAITADYQDLLSENSRKAENAVSIVIEGADVLSGPQQSFQFTFPSCYAHVLGKFNRTYPYYMNYHWRVFRAKGETARLMISDWSSEQQPGGPAGQETMINFIEVQPYIGE